jgi:hypothetical protein
MNNSLLNDPLSTIKTELERGERFDESFDLVEKLLIAYSEENIAERLYNEISLEYS